MSELKHIAIYPASHYIVPKEKMDKALRDIEREMEERVDYFKSEGKLIEAQRIRAAHPLRHGDAAGDRLLQGH